MFGLPQQQQNPQDSQKKNLKILQDVTQDQKQRYKSFLQLKKSYEYDQILKQFYIQNFTIIFEVLIEAIIKYQPGLKIKMITTTAQDDIKQILLNIHNFIKNLDRENTIQIIQQNKGFLIQKVVDKLDQILMIAFNQSFKSNLRIIVYEILLELMLVYKKIGSQQINDYFKYSLESCFVTQNKVFLQLQLQECE